MSKTRAKVHPGARMFGNALASAGSPRLRKSKDKALKEDVISPEITHAESSGQLQILEESILMFPERSSSPFENKIHLLSDIDNNYQENANDPPDEYSLPVTQSQPVSPVDLPNHLTYNKTESPNYLLYPNPTYHSSESPNNSEVYPASIYNNTESPIYTQVYPTSTYNNTEAYCPPGLSHSPMDEWGNFKSKLHECVSEVYPVSTYHNPESPDQVYSASTYHNTEEYDPTGLSHSPMDGGNFKSMQEYVSDVYPDSTFNHAKSPNIPRVYPTSTYHNTETYDPTGLSQSPMDGGNFKSLQEYDVYPDSTYNHAKSPNIPQVYPTSIYHNPETYDTIGLSQSPMDGGNYKSLQEYVSEPYPTSTYNHSKSPNHPQLPPASTYHNNTETSNHLLPYPKSTYNNTESYSPGVSHSSTDVYAFNLSNLSADPRGLERAYVDESFNQGPSFNESFDYSLPVTSQDSGCLSSEDGNSSDTSVKDYSLPLSTSYYHTVNSCEMPSKPKEVPNDSSSEEQPKVKDSTAISGRVNRRSLPRVQGPTTSLTTVSRTTKNVPVPRRSLPVPTPQYIPAELSDDSGADVSTDDEQGCKSCEKESQMLSKADGQKSYRLLPDYSRLDFLGCKTNPGFIDSHCHLDFLFQRQNYDGTYADYMLKHRDSYPASYEGCVAVFCNPNTFYRTKMWEKYLKEEGVWAAFGCHPHNANIYSDLKDSDLQEALKHPKVRALGECGLDYSNRNDCSKERQFQVLRRQLNLAKSHNLPVVIHCRDANEDLMRIMKEILPRDYRIHLHCFTDGWEWARRWLDAFSRLFIGLTNLVTYNSAQPTHQVAKKIPLDRLLLETDAPYFIPRMSPRSTKYSHPGMAIHVAAQIAMLRNLPLKEIIHRTRQNTNTMYGI